MTTRQTPRRIGAIRHIPKARQTGFSPLASLAAVTALAIVLALLAVTVSAAQAMT